MKKFKDKLSLVPTLPGCYQMKNKDGIIIYVGKAKNLKRRLSSYFNKTQTGKTLMLVNDIDTFEYIVTSTEIESLILEITLIKKYNPKYNILLKDDKSYPYIEFIERPYPSLKVVRNVKELILNGTPRPVLGKELNLINDLRLTTDTKVFFHAGRISKPKNQLILCKVFDRLIKEGNDVVLAIAGTAEEKTIFEERSRYFSKRLVYLGDRNDVPNLMAQSDAFCLPSIWEGLPVTLLEALSVGCIPICSPVGGIVNIINSGRRKETDKYL